MRTRYRCKICRKEFTVNLPKSQSYLRTNCPFCQSKRDYHHNLSGGKPEDFCRTFKQYLYLKRYVEGVVFPYWDTCVRIIGRDMAERLIKMEEKEYNDLVRKELKRK